MAKKSLTKKVSKVESSASSRVTAPNVETQVVEAPVVETALTTAAVGLSDGAQRPAQAHATGLPTSIANLMKGLAVRQKAQAPEGWVKLPLELRPFWSPIRSKQPLQGILLTQARLEVEQITVLAIKLTMDTDVVLPNGEDGVAKVGQEVIVPQFYALGGIAQLLARKDIFYQVFIANPQRVEIGSADAGTPMLVWSFDAVVNPQGIPRAMVGGGGA